MHSYFNRKTDTGNVHDKCYQSNIRTGYDGSKCDKWKVYPRIWDKIRLEFCQIDVYGTIKSERSSYGGDDLADESVQVPVGWSLNVKITLADVIDGLIVDNKGTVRVTHGSMSC